MIVCSEAGVTRVTMPPVYPFNMGGATTIVGITGRQSAPIPFRYAGAAAQVRTTTGKTMCTIYRGITDLGRLSCYPSFVMFDISTALTYGVGHGHRDELLAALPQDRTGYSLRL